MKKENPDLYYEDVEVGDEFLTVSRTISESDVMLFAGLTGDNNELHTSAIYAQESSHGQRIVHGLLTLAMANGLYTRLNYFSKSMISNLEIRDWKFNKAVMLGDTIHVSMVLAEKHLTSDHARGIFNWHVDVFNQKNEVVATGTWIKMIANR